MEMTPRERMLATAAFEPVDRPFRFETLGFWPETLRRWHSEGLPPEVNSEVAAFVHFEMDLQIPVLLGAHLHPGFDPLFEEEVLREEGDFIIKRDIAGSVVKCPREGVSTIPQWLESPVKDRGDWERVRERLDPATEGRLEFWRPLIEAADTSLPLCVYMPGLFGTHRHLMGLTPLLVAYRTQPGLLHEIAGHWVFLWKGVLSRIADIRRPDMVALWEDMCYRNGPMISQGAFEMFMSPYYTELVGFIRGELGVPIVMVDTDGDLTLLIPKFVDTGVNALWPFEVQAGMDVLAVRERWPRDFAIIGGIDKRALFEGREKIDAEVSRVVPPMLEKGGYVPAIDHAVPPEVPLDNWKYFLERVREVGGSD